MENEKFEKMKDRATRRRDWVFSLSPYSPYAVLKNKVVWWAEFEWPEAFNVFEYSFGFAVNIWKAEDLKQAINMLEYIIFKKEN